MTKSKFVSTKISIAIVFANLLPIHGSLARPVDTFSAIDDRASVVLDNNTNSPRKIYTYSDLIESPNKVLATIISTIIKKDLDFIDVFLLNQNISKILDVYTKLSIKIPDVFESNRVDRLRSEIYFGTLQYLIIISYGLARSDHATINYISLENQSRVKRLATDWAKSACDMSDSFGRDIKTIWRSENHHLLRAGACWLASDLISKHVRSPPQVRETFVKRRFVENKWGQYFKDYLSNQGSKGGFIEFYSPTYSQYSLLICYILNYFSKDGELAHLARATIDVWWAIWLQEQIDGVHGGAKTRVYSRYQTKGSPMPSLSWIYFGQGIRPLSIAPSEIFMLLMYRPSNMLGKLATELSFNISGAGFNRVRGYATRPRGIGFIYHVADEVLPVVRQFKRGVGYVISSSGTYIKSTNTWLEISTQNRWAGVTLGDGYSTKRIIPGIVNADARPIYDGLFIKQCEGVMIVKANPDTLARVNSNAFGIVRSDNLSLAVANAWLIVNDSAYVAAKPVDGAWVKEALGRSFIRVADQSTSIVILVRETKEYSDINDFKRYVSTVEVERNAEIITVSDVDSIGRKRLLCSTMSEFGKHIAINDRPENYIISMPNIKQAVDSSVVHIFGGNFHETVDFKVRR